MLKKALANDQIKELEFTQLITRVSHPETTDNYATKWFPEVEASLKQAILKNKARLVHYMLYAKYSKQELKKDKLKDIFGDDFDEICAKASASFSRV